MNEYDLVGLLNRLGEGVGVPSAPAEQILRERSRVRRRRLTSTVIASTVAVVVIVTAAVAVTGGAKDAIGPSATTSNTSCEPFVGTIQESTQFTPYRDRLSTLPEFPLNPGGERTPPVPPDLSVPSVNGVSRQWAVIGSDGAVYQYYLDQPIGPDMTLADFQAAGGIELDADPAHPKRTFASLLQAQFGDRVTSVEVGDTTGALVWADPERSDELRMHHVYWDHNGFTFGLIVNQSPEAAVSSAREVACGLG